MPSMGHVPTDLTTVLLAQWQSAPRLRSIVTDINTPARDEVHEALTAFARNLNVDTAEGVWLDFIGARLGLRRPSTGGPTSDLRFGFTGPSQARGFDQQPFKGSEASAASYPLPDAVYRAFIKARAIAIIGDGTTETLRRAIFEIDPGAAVQDRRDMTIRVLTSRRAFLELADRSGALPRNAGVRLMYEGRGAFGYDDAGVGFDLGPFGSD